MKDIVSATNNFDRTNVIGGGGFGRVYKGDLSLPDGQMITVAFKQLDRRSLQQSGFSPATFRGFPQQHVAGETYPHRNVAGESSSGIQSPAKMWVPLVFQSNN
ncbi:kinase-like domain, phloem protein 2-like protein [Tanacetum coccineum]|uniref:non-specific serine/threonine protein kinase n=1 Tax=Tanacetum coccineum TaxID=301880 RepID=A0ABQ4YR89_9ASTR